VGRAADREGDGLAVRDAAILTKIPRMKKEERTGSSHLSRDHATTAGEGDGVERAGRAVARERRDADAGNEEIGGDEEGGGGGARRETPIFPVRQ